MHLLTSYHLHRTGNYPNDGKVIKVDLSQDSPIRVNALTLTGGYWTLQSVVLRDNFAFFGLGEGSPNPRVVKIDLDPDLPVRVSVSATMSSIYMGAAVRVGDFGYFGTQSATSFPARVMKVDLTQDPPVEVAHRSFVSYQSNVIFILHKGDYLYCGIFGGGSSSIPAQLIRLPLF